MAVGLEQIINDTNNLILSGGRRTTAANVRALITEIASSYINIVDGGNVLQSLIGYSTDLTPSDPKHLITLKYFQENAPIPDLTPYLKKDGSVSMSGNLNLGGNSLVNGSVDWSLLVNIPSTLVLTSGSYSDPSWITSLSYSKLTGNPTTISGYGITDAYTKIAADARYLQLSGGILTGALTLNADASSNLQPVTLQQMNAALVGLWNDRGNYDASGNTFPSSGGSGTSGAIRKGDIWTISVAGTLGGVAVQQGDIVRALVNNPGSTSSNWAIGEHDFGYTPLSNTLNSAYIFVGNSSNIAIGVSLSGDASINNSGVMTLSNSAVIGKVLTGYTSGAGTVSAADTILQAIQKLNGNIGAISTSQWTSTGSDIYYNTGNVMIGANSAPSSKLHIVETGTTSPRGFILDQYNNGINSSQDNHRKARGTFAVPLTIVTGDVLSNRNTWAYDGTSWIQSSGIRVTSVGTIGTGRTPSKMEFMTMTDVTTGILTTALTLDQSQNATVAGNISAANLSLSGVFTTAGAFNLTLSVPRSTTYTLPNTASETLAGLGTAQSFTAQQTFTGSATQMASLSLLDTTYKTALDVSASSVLRLGNGFSSVLIGAPTLVVPVAINSAGATLTISTAGLNLSANGGVRSSIAYGSTSTGTFYHWSTTGSFTKSSINAEYRAWDGGSLTINQTGTSIGDVSIFYANPIITSFVNTNILSGFRSEISSGTGKYNFYSGSSATNKFVGSTAFFGTESFGGGVGVMFMANAGTNPSSNPTGGGILYIDSGALKYRGSSGTVTTLGNA